MQCHQQPQRSQQPNAVPAKLAGLPAGQHSDRQVQHNLQGKPELFYPIPDSAKWPGAALEL